MKKIWIAVLIIGLILTGRFAYTTFALSAEIILNGDETIYVEAGTEFEDPGATALRSDGMKKEAIQGKGKLDLSKEGSYELTYSYGNFLKSYKKLEQSLYKILQVL
ncbi:hypothetical protein P261_00754 [Lachnospiraceae bacterium TWA4]|nr:hypothetical protein P261_00754 [Lachnospiraceae bacterium TWA4]